MKICRGCCDDLSQNHKSEIGRRKDSASVSFHVLSYDINVLI
jgi:hypothetical protein